MTTEQKGKEQAPVLETLRGFITKARRETYAGDGQPVEPPLLEGSTQLEYREGFYLYRDIFFSGDNKFGGFEIVYEQFRPVWMMSYFGRVKNLQQFQPGSKREKLGPLSEKNVYIFLKLALLTKADEVRFGKEGKRKFVYGNWEYKEENRKETIKLGGVIVYSLQYQLGNLFPGFCYDTELAGIRRAPVSGINR